MNFNPGVISNCYQSMYSMIDDQDAAAANSSFPLEINSSSSGAAVLPQDQNHSTSLLYSLSVLKEKVHQAKSLLGVLIAPPDHHLQSQHHHHQSRTDSSTSSTMDAVASMNNVIQEIIVTASSMMFTCQQMANVASGNHTRSEPNFDTSRSGCSNNISDASFYSTYDQPLDDLYSTENYSNDVPARDVISRSHRQVEAKYMPLRVETKVQNLPPKNSSYDIIELDAADLLAKYTHYCQVCGKGFKRDANLRMHMRAHGDEYKTTVALSNPLKHKITSSAVSRHGSSNSPECSIILPRKYSCPHEGCRWNQKHAKFQPLKSMICVKNHYKRSHCPKMYICKRCNGKKFSVLSDLRTHEKHCGDLRWQCSCGTTFSRKDKLMGHVALFVGHTPVMIMNSTMPIRNGKTESQSSDRLK